MSMSVKRGKYGARLDAVMALATLLYIVGEFFREKDINIEITSGREGQHTRSSKHYIGHAFDLKPKAVSASSLLEYRNTLAHRLGDDFDVIANTKKGILHFEFDPKKSLGKL